MVSWECNINIFIARLAGEAYQVKIHLEHADQNQIAIIFCA